MTTKNSRGQPSVSSAPPPPSSPAVARLAAADDPTLARDAEGLHRVLAELMRVIQFRDRDRICCYDVSVTQCHALDALALRGETTSNQLAADLYLDKSTVSRVVDALVEKGYARRLPHPSDRRSVIVEATDRGRELRERIEEDLLKEMRALAGELDPEVRRAMIHLLGRLGRAAAGRVEASGGCCRLR